MTPGAVVGRRFTILSLAGKGAVGEVYRARDGLTGFTVALKLFVEKASFGSDRFEREAGLLSELRHPAIVEHVAHGVEKDGTLYIAMEWLEGEDLGARLEHGPLEVDETLELGRVLSSGLANAHALGIVHRDLKPSNIVLTAGSATRAKIIDFGLARQSGSASITRVGDALGTPAYMAPEQAKGAAVDVRADVFALGTLFFECLAGRPPFWASSALGVMAKILFEPPPSLADLRADLPTDLVTLIDRMLEKEPEKRPRDGSEVLAALTAIIARRSRSKSRVANVIDHEESTLGERERRLLSVVFVGGVERSMSSGPMAYAPTLHAGIIGEGLDSVYATVLAHGGWAERLIDGSIVISLPAPDPLLDQVAAAATCALAVRRAMPRSPMALVTGRTDGTEGFPIGDVIDRGTRLLAAEIARSVADEEDASGIAIDDVTAGLLDRRFRIVGRGNALSLVGEVDAQAALRTLLGRPSRFLGRDSEMALLNELQLACLRDRKAQAVIVTGAPGVGKSRIRKEMSLSLASDQPTTTVLLASGDTTQRGTPLGVLAEAMGDLFGIHDGEDEEIQRQRIRARVGRRVQASERARITAFLGELCSVHFPEDTVGLLAWARADRSRMGAQIRLAWEDFISAELEGGPVVILLDDAQATDASSMHVIDSALRSFAARALFVLVFARPELDTVFPKLFSERKYTSLILRPLPPESVREMVRAALPSESDEKEIDRLADQSGGNAFFIEELVRAVADGRGNKLPETVVAMAESNLDSLAPRARRLLRAASVIGRQFSLEALSALLPGETNAALEAVLADLCDREILVRKDRYDPSPLGQGFAFVSEIARVASYAKLAEDDRMLAHRLAGEWLEAAAGPRDAVLVADHFDRAGEERRAAIWYARSAEIALEQGDFAEAVERADRGAIAGATGALLGRTRLLQAEAHRHLGSSAAMLERAKDAMTLLPVRSPGWWTATADALLGATRLGQLDVATALAEQIASGPIAPMPDTARVALYLFQVGRDGEANRLLDVIVPAMSSPLEPLGRWGWGHRALAYRSMFVGDIGGYLGHAERAVAAFEMSADTRELCLELVAVGYVRHELGLYDQAEESLKLGERLADKLGLRHVLAAALENLGSVSIRLGKLDQAEAALTRAIALFTEQGNRRLVGQCHKLLAQLRVERGEHVEALKEAEMARDIFGSFTPLLPSALATLASIHLTMGRLDLATKEADEAMDMLERNRSIEEGETLIRLTFAEATKLRGDDAAARMAIMHAEERLRERADKILDPLMRENFLTKVRDNARTLALANAWTNS